MLKDINAEKKSTEKKSSRVYAIQTCLHSLFIFGYGDSYRFLTLTATITVSPINKKKINLIKILPPKSYLFINMKTSPNSNETNNTLYILVKPIQKQR